MNFTSKSAKSGDTLIERLILMATRSTFYSQQSGMQRLQSAFWPKHSMRFIPMNLG
ncbi:hypothetical protein AM1_D0136 (plasmid) [Acaryochloris marina MBIC11017]|uniref:Uncharacterized protein n=1 Tax=Acaryochloris marina (strain MBIC 11017) TaxID=329726 RepID=A8ZNP5_ACAM1|nr:hypothetical protein AM1_D0136 [Acaryochloris marina MBIC11017]